jgi:hypothetical protein
MNGSPTPLLDRIEKRRREAVVIPFPVKRPPRQPRWLERLQAKDMSDWRPDDAA